MQSTHWPGLVPVELLLTSDALVRTWCFMRQQFLTAAQRSLRLCSPMGSKISKKLLLDTAASLLHPLCHNPGGTLVFPRHSQSQDSQMSIVMHMGYALHTGRVAVGCFAPHDVPGR